MLSQTQWISRCSTFPHELTALYLVKFITVCHSQPARQLTWHHDNSTPNNCIHLEPIYDDFDLFCQCVWTWNRDWEHCRVWTHTWATGGETQEKEKNKKYGIYSSDILCLLDSNLLFRIISRNGWNSGVHSWMRSFDTTDSVIFWVKQNVQVVRTHLGL